MNRPAPGQEPLPSTKPLRPPTISGVGCPCGTLSAIDQHRFVALEADPDVWQICGELRPHILLHEGCQQCKPPGGVHKSVSTIQQAGGNRWIRRKARRLKLVGFTQTSNLKAQLRASCALSLAQPLEFPHNLRALAREV